MASASPEGSKTAVICWRYPAVCGEAGRYHQHRKLGGLAPSGVYDCSGR